VKRPFVRHEKCLRAATGWAMQLLANPRVGAILMAGQPSVTVLGVGDILYGRTSPAGRMVQTTYPASFAEEVSIFDMNMRPGPSAWPAPGQPPCSSSSSHDSLPPCKNGTNPGRTHRFYSKRPTLPFGFGLSYSKFTYTVVRSSVAPSSSSSVQGGGLSLSRVRDLLAATAPSAAADADHAVHLVPAGQDFAAVQHTINVTNVGERDADDVVLGFLHPPGAGRDGVPLQSLCNLCCIMIRTQSGSGLTVQSPRVAAPMILHVD
jgi:beta-D-xylosidase 4